MFSIVTEDVCTYVITRGRFIIYEKVYSKDTDLPIGSNGYYSWSVIELKSELSVRKLNIL